MDQSRINFLKNNQKFKISIFKYKFKNANNLDFHIFSYNEIFVFKKNFKYYKKHNKKFIKNFTSLNNKFITNIYTF